MDIYRKRAMKDYESAVRDLRSSELFLYPKKNWIKRMRSVIGMTVNQLAKRLHVTPARVRVMEKSEMSGRLKVETLERIAESLNCKLVYTFVPKEDLFLMFEQQAKRKAQEVVSATAYTMGLEDQATDRFNQQLILDDLQDKLMSHPEKEGLWDE